MPEGSDDLSALQNLNLRQCPSGEIMCLNSLLMYIGVLRAEVDTASYQRQNSRGRCSGSSAEHNLVYFARSSFPLTIITTFTNTDMDTTATAENLGKVNLLLNVQINREEEIARGNGPAWTKLGEFGFWAGVTVTRHTSSQQPPTVTGVQISFISSNSPLIPPRSRL